jgi:hypothetical protein
MASNNNTIKLPLPILGKDIASTITNNNSNTIDPPSPVFSPDRIFLRINIPK